MRGYAKVVLAAIGLAAVGAVIGWLLEGRSAIDQDGVTEQPHFEETACE